MNSSSSSSSSSNNSSSSNSSNRPLRLLRPADAASSFGRRAEDRKNICGCVK